MNRPLASASTWPLAQRIFASLQCLRPSLRTRRPYSRIGAPEWTGRRYSTSIWRVMAVTPSTRTALLMASSRRVAIMPPCT